MIGRTGRKKSTFRIIPKVVLTFPYAPLTKKVVFFVMTE